MSARAYGDGDGDFGAQVPHFGCLGAQQCPHQGLSGTKIVSARAHRDGDGDAGGQFLPLSSRSSAVSSPGVIRYENSER